MVISLGNAGRNGYPLPGSLGFGLGIVPEPFPTSYATSATDVSKPKRSTGALSCGRTPVKIDSMNAPAQISDYAKCAWSFTEKSRAAIAAAGKDDSLWRKALDKYRWAHDFYTWSASKSISAEQQSRWMATAKGALRTAEDAERVAKGTTAPVAVPTSRPTTAPAPFIPSQPSPTAEASFLGGEVFGLPIWAVGLGIAALGTGAYFLLGKKKRPLGFVAFGSRHALSRRR